MNQELDKDLILANFQAMANCQDIDISLALLEDNDWDEMKALQAYMDTQAQAQQEVHYNEPQVAGKKIIKERLVDDGQDFDEALLIRLQQQMMRQRQRAQTDESIGDIFWSSSLGMGFSKVGGWVGALWRQVPHFIRGVQSGGEQFYVSLYSDGNNNPMPNFLLGVFRDVQQRATQQNQLIFLYIRSRGNTNCTQFEQILTDPDIRTYLNDNYVCYGLDLESVEGSTFANENNVQTIPYVALIQIRDHQQHVIIQRESKSKEELLELLQQGLDTQEQHIQQTQMRIQEEQKNQQMFEDMLSQERNQEVNNVQEGRALREQQRRELEEANIMDASRRQQQEMQRAQEREANAEQERQQQEMREQKLQKQSIAQEQLKSLGEEPEDANDICTIVFRHPTGRFQRRFHKTSTIQDLYTYIDSQHDQINFEQENSDYQLMQNMPKKIYTDKSKTLIDEGLFPRAMIQIHEL